jgi:glycine hydroxymethyltransferase
MVFLAMLEPGDTIMSLNLANGGHLSHLHATSNFLKFFKLVNYDVKETAPARSTSTKTTTSPNSASTSPNSSSSASRPTPAPTSCGSYQAAHDAGALVLADIAHINGLVAAGLHDTPFKAGDEGADFVSMTTHKTFRGPRGAMLFAKKDHIGAINKTIFPGTSGGPHLHAIAATGQALLEILGEDQYPDKRVIQRLLASRPRHLQSPGGGRKKRWPHHRQPHPKPPLPRQSLPDTVDSLEFQRLLERVGIITNRNMIPFDPKSAWRPSGMRLGTPPSPAAASPWLNPMSSVPSSAT